ncbi:hypothetical protein [Pedobacter aquatilis]|uniref:hypothetical protein n=1 Tax=Pedobacter aquatilis TaxID=351343 RepID=UPI00292F154E|nr:hypothetical protein [Pedobacter aquatilis]
MWVTKNSTWNEKSTKLERFFIEKIIQRCDYDETISKKHRTINGYTQLKELIRLAELSKKRIKTLRTLAELIREAKSKNVKQNIVNDTIIDLYFQDLKVYILHFNEVEAFKNDSLDKIDILLHVLKKHCLQLEKYYFKNIVTELKKIDFNEKNKIERTVARITELVDVTIPVLLHQGYSISSLNEVLRRWIEGKHHINLNKFLDFFNHSNENFDILIYIGNNSIEIEELKKVIYKLGDGDIRKASEFENDFSPKRAFGPRDEVIYYNCAVKDPVSFVRDRYDELLKNIVVYRDRNSLSLFANFFRNSYWKKSNIKGSIYKNIIISGDPISVVSRKSTLFGSLQTSSKSSFVTNSNLDFIENEQLKRSIYYYNLAIGSKSIENSLSLLWTSIESILPYRSHKSDIENIREIFSKTFSFGSIARDIQYLIRRIIVVNNVNKGCFNSIGLSSLPKNFTGKDLIKWFDWFKDDPVKKFKKFNTISSLLAHEYLNTIKQFDDGRLSNILSRIDSSKDSIGFQLQRIYLHRNQIVHSGDYINEYTNLWIHLEWYVGKFLYFSILETEITKNFSSLEDLFRDLESDFDYCYSYIEKNKNKMLKDSSKIVNQLLNVDWQ